PARERRCTVRPDILAHADVHGCGHLGRGRPRRRPWPEPSQRRLGRAGLQVHLREPEGPAPALLHTPEPQPPRTCNQPECRSRAVAPPRQDVRGGTPLLAREQALAQGTPAGRSGVLPDAHSCGGDISDPFVAAARREGDTATGAEAPFRSEAGMISHPLPVTPFAPQPRWS